MTASPDLRQLLEYICQRAGLVFTDARAAEVHDAVQRALDRFGYSSITDLYQRVRRDDVAFEELVAELTIGETYFFRDRSQFEVLDTYVLPQLAGRAAQQPLRVWSAGCATGEEAYSLAIWLDHAGLSQRATVLGTDISRARLQQAQKARYRNWSLRGVPDDEIARYFRRVGRDFEVAARFTHAVEFAYLNLAEDVYPSLASGVWGMDIIFCRNVLIYFDEEIVRRVSRQLIAALSDDGWLLLGASDPPLHEFPECETVVTEAGLIYRRRRERAVRAPAPPPKTPARIDAQPVRFAPMRETPAAATAAGPAVTEEAAWVTRVRTLANQGHVRDALALVTQALTEHRFSAELLYLQAVLESEQGRARDALASARRAIYLDRDMVVAHILMAQVQNRLGLAVSARRSLINAQTLLENLPPDQPIRAADGEPAARLAEMVRLQLQFLGDVA